MPGFGINDDELSKLFAEAGEAVKKVKSEPTPTPRALDDPVSVKQPEPAVAEPPAKSALAWDEEPPAKKALAWDEEPPKQTVAWNEEPPARKGLAWDEDPAPAKQAVAWNEEPPAKKTVGWDEDPSTPTPASNRAAVEEPTWTPRLPATPAPAASGPQVRLVGGEQADDALTAKAVDGASVRIPWAQMKGLTVGRVGDRMLLAFMFSGKAYYFSDDNVAYKGFLRNMQSTISMNWRGLVGEIAGRVTDKSDPGVSALSGAGGMVPRYNDHADFFNKLAARG